MKLKDVWDQPDVKPGKPFLVEMLQDAGFTKQQISELSLHDAMKALSEYIEGNLPDVVKCIKTISQMDYALTKSPQKRAALRKLLNTDEPLRKESVTATLRFAAEVESLIENLKRLEDLVLSNIERED